MTFHRTALADEMAQQLLSPSYLDTSLRPAIMVKTPYIRVALLGATVASGLRWETD
jgi:hypothetical protein